MRTKRKAIAIINRNHVMIRLPPSPRRIEFSEATKAEAADREHPAALATDFCQHSFTSKQPSEAHFDAAEHNDTCHEGWGLPQSNAEASKWHRNWRRP